MRWRGSQDAQHRRTFTFLLDISSYSLHFYKQLFMYHLYRLNDLINQGMSELRNGSSSGRVTVS